MQGVQRFHLRKLREQSCDTGHERSDLGIALRMQGLICLNICSRLSPTKLDLPLELPLPGAIETFVSTSKANLHRGDELPLRGGPMSIYVPGILLRALSQPSRPFHAWHMPNHTETVDSRCHVEDMPLTETADIKITAMDPF